MKMSKITLAVSSITVAALLSACSGAHYGSHSTGSGWGNYKCTAMRGQAGRKFTGWSTHKGTARSNAMSKCESGYSGSCHISQCTNQS